jgi:hypothetical protein
MAELLPRLAYAAAGTGHPKIQLRHVVTPIRPLWRIVADAIAMIPDGSR